MYMWVLYLQYVLQYTIIYKHVHITMNIVNKHEQMYVLLHKQMYECKNLMFISIKDPHYKHMHAQMYTHIHIQRHQALIY